MQTQTGIFLVRFTSPHPLRLDRGEGSRVRCRFDAPVALSRSSLRVFQDLCGKNSPSKYSPRPTRLRQIAYTHRGETEISFMLGSCVTGSEKAERPGLHPSDEAQGVGFKSRERLNSSFGSEGANG